MHSAKKFLSRVALGLAGLGTAAAIACAQDPTSGYLSNQPTATPHRTIGVAGMLLSGNTLRYNNINFVNESSENILLLGQPIERLYEACGVDLSYDYSIVFQDAEIIDGRGYRASFLHDGKSITAIIGLSGIARTVRESVYPTMTRYAGIVSQEVGALVCAGGYFDREEFTSNRYMQELVNKARGVILSSEPVFLNGIRCYLACPEKIPP